MYFLYVVHFTLFVGAIHWSVGKLLSKHPRISLIVLSMSAPGRTPCWRSMETRSCSKLNSLSSFEFCFWHILVTDGWMVRHITANSISGQYCPHHWECEPSGAYHVMEEGGHTSPLTHTAASAAGFTLVSHLHRLLCFSFTLLSH